MNLPLSCPVFRGTGCSTRLRLCKLSLPRRLCSPSSRFHRIYVKVSSARAWRNDRCETYCPYLGDKQLELLGDATVVVVVALVEVAVLNVVKDLVVVGDTGPAVVVVDDGGATVADDFRVVVELFTVDTGGAVPEQPTRFEETTMSSYQKVLEAPP